MVPLKTFYHDPNPGHSDSQVFGVKRLLCEVQLYTESAQILIVRLNKFLFAKHLYNCDLCNHY